MANGYTTFESEFKWARTWIPRLRTLIGPCLLREGTLQEDQLEATDLIVLRTEGLRVACRVRHTGYAKTFRDEVTITCERESGAACEWDKMILAGFGDWFFYGHATKENAERGDIIPRYLIDLHVARDWIKHNHGPKRRNKDRPGRGCWFYPVNVPDMNRGCDGKALIASRVEQTDESAKSLAEHHDWIEDYKRVEEECWPRIE